MSTKKRAQRNKTITLTASERKRYHAGLFKLDRSVTVKEVVNKVICGDIFAVARYLPAIFADLVFIDPPYNLNKSFHSGSFKKMPPADYSQWLESLLGCLSPLLKPTASVYICADWRCSAAVHNVCSKFFTVRNRITWEREKGRGAKTNWKNASEDIFFCTVSKQYTFNLQEVKLRRKVIAPYTSRSGGPKGWQKFSNGNFRDTHPSNLWTDITVPFWSMPENTVHPTQKPEKLLAKIILASSIPGDLVFEPLAGSGTACVTARKLGREFLGVENAELYCCIIGKRLESAERDKTIQGYRDGVFWERNTLRQQMTSAT